MSKTYRQNTAEPSVVRRRSRHGGQQPAKEFGWRENTKSYLLADSEGVRLAEGIEDKIYIIFHLNIHA